MNFDCPKCEAEIKIDGVNPWSMLGENVTCPECGLVCEVDGDYTGEDSWGFWLVNLKAAE